MRSVILLENQFEQLALILKDYIFFKLTLERFNYFIHTACFLFICKLRIIDFPFFSRQKLLVIDARSYTTAVANRARGGGCECPDYYPHMEIKFMNLANIHYIRKSFHSLRQLCASTPEQQTK